MTRAAQSALDLILQQYPDAGRWQIICGAGNNAGDGYVLARLAAQQGIVVSVISAAPPESLQGDAETAYLDFRAEIGVLADYEGNLDSEAELLVDALLGSGIQRDVTGRFAEVIENRSDIRRTKNIRQIIDNPFDTHINIIPRNVLK